MAHAGEIGAQRATANLLERCHVRAGSGRDNRRFTIGSLDTKTGVMTDIIIDQFAVIRGTPILADLFGYPLLTGEAKETAGGMLIAVSKENADDLLDELDKRKVRHFQVGYVKEGNGDVHVQKNVKVMEE